MRKAVPFAFSVEKSLLTWQKVYHRQLWRLWLISAILITSFIYINTWKRKIMAGIWKQFQTVVAAEWKRIGKMKESGLIAQTKVDNRRPNDLNKWWTTNHNLIQSKLKSSIEGINKTERWYLVRLVRSDKWKQSLNLRWLYFFVSLCPEISIPSYPTNLKPSVRHPSQTAAFPWWCIITNRAPIGDKKLRWI